MPWHTLPLSEIENRLGTAFRSGLSKGEAAKRLRERGPNALPAGAPEHVATIFLRQFRSPLIYILLAAAATVYALGSVTDAVVIAAVLVLNAAVGAAQEGRAQRTLLALKTFVTTDATVVREGEEMIVPDRELVAGDIVLLHEGERVPADLRIIESLALEVNEAPLTGESLPVPKREGVVRRADAPPSEERNMLFKGTYVTRGSGRAAVVATGIATVIGGISAQVERIDTSIPLARDIAALSRVIIEAVTLIALSFFAIGAARGVPVETMFRAVVSLSVSLIPEGLPVALTVVLAAGAWRMARRHALVKRLQAVEALGQIGVIAVDKTGTLTKNEMVIREVWIDESVFEVGGAGYEPQGEITSGGTFVNPPNHPALLLAGKIGALCASASPIFSVERKRWEVRGDPTEAAMAVFAGKVGFRHADVLAESPLLAEEPFDYRTKCHLRSHRLMDRQFISVAGAPEHVLASSDRLYRSSGAVEPLTSAARNRIESAHRTFSRRGFRVVAFGYKEVPLPAAAAGPVSIDANHFVFTGLYAMEDALRPEVPDAMARASAAGIKVVMITGDHALTAEQIAREAGIWKEGERVYTGEEIDRMNDETLARAAGLARVFARVTPAHKLRIIQAYRARGERIAMTGDGVNDAPSLVAADLGVAMGGIGTEVAKEAGDIVLLDDDFGTIVAAVEEGRSIYQTIRKVILYLFSTSLGELFAIVGAVALGYPLPLAPVQILWLNLVTDGFLVVALAMEPKEPGLLVPAYARPPKFFVDRRAASRMFLMGFVMAVGSFALFRAYYPHDSVKAWTITLTALAVFQWLNAWNCRRDERSLFHMSPFSNPSLVAATLIVIALQLLALYVAPLRMLLSTAPLTLAEWALVVAVACSVIVVEELRKYVARTHRV